jgi:hypothetical protein
LLALLVLIGYCIYSSPSRTIALHTWKAAIRFRFFWVMAMLLLAAVVALPMVLKGDGTPEGLAQILITYTLSFAFFFLGAGTLWMSAGTLARDIEDSHMQMIATKPIARWQIWMGKWIGIMAMNLVLLGLVAGAVLVMVEYRAHRLTTEEYKLIQDQTDIQVFRSAIEAGVDVFERDEKTLKILKAEKPQPLLEASRNFLSGSRVGLEIMRFSSQQDTTNAQPKLKPMADLRWEVAGLKEKKLRQQVLIARAALPLEDVRIALTPTRTISLEESYQSRVEENARDQIQQEEDRRRKEKQQFESMNRKYLIPVKLDAAEKAAFTNEVARLLRIQSQVLAPGDPSAPQQQPGLQFQFAKPIGFDLPEDKRLILKFNFEDPQVNYSDSRQYGILYMYGPGHRPDLIKVPSLLTARKTYELPMHGHTVVTNGELQSIFGTNRLFCVTFVNVSDQIGRSPSFLKVPFMDETNAQIDPSKVQVLYPESGFALNLFRSCGILLAWLGIFTALGLCAASFMSFNVSAFACLAILFVATIGMDQMKAVLKDGTIMQTYSAGQREKSFVDWFALPAFSVLVPVIDAQKDYSPISNLAQGESTTWSELVRAYSFIWGISGWLLGLIGVIIFSRRQLAIHGGQVS